MFVSSNLTVESETVVELVTVIISLGLLNTMAQSSREKNQNTKS